MDNRNSLFSKTVQLACRVLQEQIQNKDSKTQLEREFLEAMGLNTQKPTQDMGEDSLPSSDPDLATPRFSYGTSSDGPAEQPDRHQGFFPGKNKKELRDQLEKVKTERDEARKQINESQKNERILQQENSELRGELSSARKRIENLEHQLRLQQSMLPEQDQQQLTALQDGIEALPPSARELIASFYELNDLTIFLIQCGQFSRLNQCWEACCKSITDAEPREELSSFLERLLTLYNRSVKTIGEKPATLIAPHPGDTYDSGKHFRIASDGRTVRKLLLPGLRNPGGKVMQQARVALQ